MSAKEQIAKQRQGGGIARHAARTICGTRFRFGGQIASTDREDIRSNLRSEEGKGERTLRTLGGLVHQRGEPWIGQGAGTERGRHAQSGGLSDYQAEQHVVGFLVDEVVARTRTY